MHEENDGIVLGSGGTLAFVLCFGRTGMSILPFASLPFFVTACMAADGQLSFLRCVIIAVWVQSVRMTRGEVYKCCL